MAKIVMLKKIAVEKMGRSNGPAAQNPTPPAMSAGAGGFFKIPENLNNFGTIRFLPPELESKILFVGAQVYFGPQFEQCQLQGVDVLVMEPTNLIAALSNEQA